MVYTFHSHLYLIYFVVWKLVSTLHFVKGGGVVNHCTITWGMGSEAFLGVFKTSVTCLHSWIKDIVHYIRSFVGLFFSPSQLFILHFPQISNSCNKGEFLFLPISMTFLTPKITCQTFLIFLNIESTRMDNLLP